MAKFILLLALFVGLFGCNSTSIKPDPSKPATVSLKEAGSGEKTLIRFKPVAGASEEIKFKMTLDVTLAGQKMPIPAITMTFDMKTTEVKSDGSFSYEYKVSKASMDGVTPVDGRVFEAAQGKLRELEGLGGTARLTDRGIILENKINIPSGVSDETQETIQNLNQSLGQIMAPMPEEAVGPGAKWDVTQAIESKGIVITQVAHYELVSRTGDQVELKVNVEQSAGAQEFEAKGMKVKLESMSSKGGGVVSMDVTKLAPKNSKMDLDSKMTMNVKDQTQSIDMGIHIDVN